MPPIRPVLFGAVVALLCAAPAAAAPSVVASTKPVHSLVAGVMQGVAEARLLVTGAQSPHTYALKPSDALALEEADLVIWVGPGAAPFLTRAVGTIASPGAELRLIEVPGLTLHENRTGGVWETHGEEMHASSEEPLHEEEHGHEEEHDHGHAHASETGGPTTDPHVWLNPDNARLMVRAIAARLSKLDPANATAYAKNAERAEARIRQADARAADLLAPVRDRPFVVFHDAYQYFETHYRLNGIGAITLSPDRRPGPRRLMELRARIAESDAVCLFREPQFPPDLVDTVVEGTGARTGTLDPLGLALDRGPDAYPELILDLARSLADCLSEPA